jgi:hypothetical protein
MKSKTVKPASLSPKKSSGVDWKLTINARLEDGIYSLTILFDRVNTGNENVLI